MYIYRVIYMSVCVSVCVYIYIYAYIHMYLDIHHHRSIQGPHERNDNDDGVDVDDVER